MMKLKLAVFAAILLGPSAAAYACKGWRAERTLPSALCAQSLLLLAWGYVLPFSWCVGIVAALSAACWLYAVVRVGSVKRAFGFLSLPLVLFLLSLPVVYMACEKRIYLSYDEHSHWGLIVKVITMFDELPREGRGAPLMLFTYPPAGAMLPAMISTLLTYRDGIANFGYGALILGLMMGLVPENARREEKLGPLLLYLCVMMLFPLSFLRLFSEPVIALLTALLIVRREGERTAWDAVSDCLYAVMLAMMKNTGIVILAFALMARMLARPSRREAGVCLRMLLLAGAAYASYIVYCRVQGISATASPSHFAENLQALQDGTLSQTYMTIPARFRQFFWSHQLPQSGVYTCYGFGTCAAVYGMLLLLSGLHIAVAEDRREALRVWAGVWAMNVLYMLMIVASYYFFFEEKEVALLSEADRYAMLPALWTGLIFCGLLLRARSVSRSRQRCVVLCLTTAAFLPLSHPEMTYHTFVTRDYAVCTIWARDEVDRQAAFLKQYIGDNRAENGLMCMGTYDYIALHYALADVTDIGIMQKSWSSAAWQGSCEAVRDELETGAYAYVFVGGLGEGDSAIDERYTPLTSDASALCANTLYRVECDAQGRATLAFVATMPEQAD